MDALAQATEAWRQGRRDEAGRMLEAIIAAEPNHLGALNALGLIALNSGEAGRAIGWLERASEAGPEAPEIGYNLCQAFLMLGQPERGLVALDRALAIDPYFVPALIKKAELLAELGRRAEAAELYRHLIAASPDLDSLPEPARQALEKGLALIRAEGEQHSETLAVPLAQVEAAFPEADLARARAYAEQRTGRRKVYVQQPVSGHFPYLPALEFFPRDHFPWLAALEAQTAAIGAELLALWREDAPGFTPYVAFDPSQPVNQWGELNHSPRWSAFFFWQDGERRDENCVRCPQTMRALEAAPLLDLPGKGPTAMFSILAPNTRIPPHTGSNNVRTTIHLPLVVPEGCGFRVGAETREWKVGEAWAFDDTIEHEAWNDSDQPRAILILDVWNPLLSEAERAAVRAIG